MKFIALLAIVATVEAGRRRHRRSKPTAEEMLAKLDTDEDGSVTEAEVEALFSAKCVHHLEHKNDWIEVPLTDDEITAACDAKWDELWAALDTDTDGVLSLEELEAHGRIHFWH